MGLAYKNLHIFIMRMGNFCITHIFYKSFYPDVKIRFANCTGRSCELNDTIFWRICPKTKKFVLLQDCVFFAFKRSKNSLLPPMESGKLYSCPISPILRSNTTEMWSGVWSNVAKRVTSFAPCRNFVRNSSGSFYDLESLNKWVHFTHFITFQLLIFFVWQASVLHNRSNRRRDGVAFCQMLW